MKLKVLITESVLFLFCLRFCISVVLYFMIRNRISNSLTRGVFNFANITNLKSDNCFQLCKLKKEGDSLIYH